MMKRKSKLIALGGLIGSGKDTVANYLCTVHGFKRMSFASVLKDTVSTIFDWDRELLEGSTKASREWREQVDEWWSKKLNIDGLTPRYILQQWGTEVIRNSFNDNIWVMSMENKLRKINQDIVITDCRFPNEIQSVKDQNGIVIRTSRGPDPHWIKYAIMYNTSEHQSQRDIGLQYLKENKIHPSEYSSVGLDYDYLLDNNDTIDNLHKQIDKIILDS